MKEISRETRNKKGELFVNTQYSFAKWVEEFAEANELTVEETLQLALFKQENIEYIPSDVQKAEMGEYNAQRIKRE